MRHGAKLGTLAAIASLALALLAAPAPAERARPYWWAQQEALAVRDGYHLLSPAEMKDLYDKGEAMVVIDARTVHEFKAGHLPGARNVEFHMGHTSRLEPEKQAEFLKVLGPDTSRRVVVYDRGLSCVRSQLAAQWAVNLGYDNVWNLAEGWTGWAALTQTRSGKGDGPPQAGPGDGFPDQAFTLLDGDKDRAYLGLAADAERLDLSRVKAEFLLVELYNELCFACCQSVPGLNRLSEMIEKTPELAGRLKMLGVGVGAQNREVHRFRRENQVGFPLVSDRDSKLYERLGSPALPVMYLVRLGGPKGPEIVAVTGSPFGQPEEILAGLRQNLAPAAR